MAWKKIPCQAAVPGGAGAAQPSRVIGDNQWKMWGSVVLRIPNPTYKRSSAQNHYWNLTVFQGDRRGTRLAIICLLGRLRFQKTSSGEKPVSGGWITDQNVLETPNWLLCFASDRFLSAIFTFRCTKQQSQPASSPEVGLIYHRIFVGTNNSFNKWRNNNSNNSIYTGEGFPGT